MADRPRPAGIDRISQLPDPILHQILSPLPTVKVVRTCILSKRWRNLWASIPHLRFSSYNEESYKIDIKRFIDMVLQLRDDSHIQTLEIDDIEADYQVVDRWIRYAATRQVQNLHLSRLVEEDRRPLPPCVFDCQSLITLTLQGYTCVETAPSVHLSRLTTFRAGDMSFEGDSLGKLISGCPSLRHLRIFLSSFGPLDIYAPRLRTLLFANNHCNDEGVAVTVSAPSLVAMVLANDSPFVSENSRTGFSISLKNVSSLARARVHIVTETDSGALMILDSLCTVQYLDLNSHTLEYIFSQIVSLEQLPAFPNLKKLEVYADLYDGPIQAITCLLQCAPNLEQLVIVQRGGLHYHYFSKKDWEPRESPASFLAKLKSVASPSRPDPSDLDFFYHVV